jgi:hypothetical protein
MSAGETDPTRREVIIAGATVASLAAIGPDQALAVPFSGGQIEVPLALHVNGVRHDLNLEPRVTLLDTLRERLNLCGTKKGLRYRTVWGVYRPYRQTPRPVVSHPGGSGRWQGGHDNRGNQRLQGRLAPDAAGVSRS